MAFVIAFSNMTIAEDSSSAGVADPNTYLAQIKTEMSKKWPGNRTINIVCHGHSVPAGYFRTPVVDTFNAYPHLLHKALNSTFAIFRLLSDG